MHAQSKTQQGGDPSPSTTEEEAGNPDADIEFDLTEQEIQRLEAGEEVTLLLNEQHDNQTVKIGKVEKPEGGQ